MLEENVDENSKISLKKDLNLKKYTINNNKWKNKKNKVLKVKIIKQIKDVNQKKRKS